MKRIRNNGLPQPISLSQLPRTLRRSTSQHPGHQSYIKTVQRAGQSVMVPHDAPPAPAPGPIQHSSLGLLLARSSALSGRPSPGTTKSNSGPKSKGPRVPDKYLGPRKPQGARGQQGPRGRGSTKLPNRPPGTLTLPAQHARRERLQASSRSKSHARAEATARPARADPGTGSGLDRAPTEPKATQGLTQGSAQVRSRQNRLQGK
ncbi:hypothetical protein NDU88_003868 [Pleurodeles waltl]|uniref:Uncharacterized protein n=1 Tax=Pleurodeles waltl TaxID=8319 RepID=A0AAV7L540_PLEWA|nr:hypothetical protein NDU88_003868 [Pleurodeles waltl]